MPVAVAPLPTAITVVPIAVEPLPIAIEAVPDAVAAPDDSTVPPPIAMAWVLVVEPPPAVYCASATLFCVAPATSMAVVTALATADLFGFPRAESISEAATQAPSDSFQIER